MNIEVKREAEFFGDIVIVPYLDNYDLVVLKTVAICEYGVSCVSLKSLKLSLFFFFLPELSDFWCDRRYRLFLRSIL